MAQMANVIFKCCFFRLGLTISSASCNQTGNILVHTFSIVSFTLIFLHTHFPSHSFSFILILFCFISELSSHGGTYRPLHTTGVRLLTTEEKHQRLRQSGIHQPGQTQQSLLTRGEACVAEGAAGGMLHIVKYAYSR